MTAIAFGFTKLVVDDLALAERFYRDVFGLKRLRQVGTDEHEFALDEVILTLHEHGHALILVRYRNRPCPPSGSVWTGFVVEDLEQTLIAIEGNGGQVRVAPHDAVEHGVRAAIASDPSGHLIEIIQVLKASS